jgi:hypothetical protein
MGVNLNCKTGLVEIAERSHFGDVGVGGGRFGKRTCAGEGAGGKNAERSQFCGSITRMGRRSRFEKTRHVSLLLSEIPTELLPDLRNSMAEVGSDGLKLWMWLKGLGLVAAKAK